MDGASDQDYCSWAAPALDLAPAAVGEGLAVETWLLAREGQDSSRNVSLSQQ